MSVKVKAYAKINLMLDIISTRKDGYHDLFMIMQSINLYDTVTISETKSKKITITCNIDDIPLDEKNIAYKAADAFFKANKIKNRGINIDIVKRIPHQAGLAGGSADGAAVLVALDNADASKKATASADNLRAQIKDYLEDSARARMEVDVARREVERLNREISDLRDKLAAK